MIDLYRRLIQRRIAFWLSVALYAGTLLAILGWPKNPATADITRLYLTCGFFAVIWLLGHSCIVLLPEMMATARQWRHGGIAKSVDDTLLYLQEEERWSLYGLLPAFTLGVVATGLAVVSLWPQFAFLAPHHSIFEVAAWLSLPILAILLIRNSQHWFNIFRLRRFLAEQFAALERTSGAIKERTGKNARSNNQNETARVLSERDGSFQAGSFEWDFDDFCRNFIVFGQPGAGKTVCVLNSVLHGLLLSDSRIGGMILDAKGDFRGKISALCEKMGRTGDLFVLDPEPWDAAVARGDTKFAGHQMAIAWNPLDSTDRPVEIVARIRKVQEIMGSKSGGDNSIFLSEAGMVMMHAIALLRYAKSPQPPSLVDVYKLCGENSNNPIIYNQILQSIAERIDNFGRDVPVDVDEAIQYFETQWRFMASRTKGGVQLSINDVLGDFLVEPFRYIFSGQSTITLTEAIDKGMIVYIYMPIAKDERMSRIVSTLIKLEYERQVLARPKKAQRTFFLADEFQTFYTAGDSDFFERSRESNHGNVIAAQNTSSFLKRSENKDDVKNFLGLCAVKVFLRNTERETNEWASGLFGHRRESIISRSQMPRRGGVLHGSTTTSYSLSQQEVSVMPPETFPALAVPGPESPFAEAVVQLASRSKPQQLRLFFPPHPIT